ncbi:MAG: MFS transporter [Chlamydiae bacterium]|nr:MFS transporter [Chlamydiota bacterium]
MKNDLKQRVLLWSGYLGNFFEHYDTALFGFLSFFLAELIFPSQDAVMALILTYAIIPLGMIARPIGALFFGYVADTYGRGEALFISLGGMGVISFLIGLTPTYGQIGLVAPLIFTIFRLLQNFFASGEVMGGGVFLLENAHRSDYDFISSVYGMTTIGGIIIASLAVSVLSFFDIVCSSWRFLYLFGSITALFGFIIRGNLRQIAPIKKMRRLSFLTCRNELFLILLISGFSYANYSISIILMNGFIPLITSYSKNQMIALNTVLLLFDFCLLPFFGLLSKKLSREKVMFFASSAITILAIPLVSLLPYLNLEGIICIRLILVFLGALFCAPFHAFVMDVVPIENRCTIISFGYAIGCQILGGPTAALSLWLFKKTGLVTSVVWYWTLLAFITSATLFIFKKRNQIVSEG